MNPLEEYYKEEVKSQKAWEEQRIIRKSDSTRVREFMEKFDLIPENPDEQWVKFRYSFLEEEMRELKIALKHGDVVGVIDALNDLSYVAQGTAIGLGFDYDRHYDAVADANLEKERGIKPGRENSGGFDVIKPKGWIDPAVRHEAIIAGSNIAEILTEGVNV